MNKAELLSQLRKHKPILAKRFGVTDIALIESNSILFCDDHINVMIWFGGPAGWRNYSGSALYLEDIFGQQVDLSTENGIREGLHPDVHMELTHA